MDRGKHNVKLSLQAKLTESMIKTKLIQDAKSCNFSCCGRTDAGVSAVGQVCMSNSITGPQPNIKIATVHI